jgi:hypothetical protein
MDGHWTPKLNSEQMDYPVVIDLSVARPFVRRLLKAWPPFDALSNPNRDILVLL